MSRARVFFYVQHLLGIGHLMRAAVLTRAMRRAGLEATVVSGGFDDAGPDLGGARLVRLPSARAADVTFKTLLGADGRPVGERWKAERRAALLAAFRAADPDVLLIEMFPFGRRRFRFELLPLLEAARGRARIACSLRDVLVAKPAADMSAVETARRYFDAVLVHGDPALIRLEESFPAAREIADLLRYTGYVAAEAAQTPAHPAEVIVSAGGGAVGGALLRMAIAARPLSAGADLPWRLLTGPNLPPEERAALAAGPGLAIETFRPDFRALLAGCAVSVSQAGYNTVADLLSARARSVLVPFAAPGQTEQAFRARRLAERGWAEAIEEADLSPRALAQAIDRALARGRSRPDGIRLDGADRSAALLAALAGRPAGAPGETSEHMAL